MILFDGAVQKIEKKYKPNPMGRGGIEWQPEQFFKGLLLGENRMHATKEIISYQTKALVSKILNASKPQGFKNI